MGTKSNPGPHDCYAKATPDEPLFILRAKDPVAPHLVEAWAALRAGDCLRAVVLMIEADEALRASGVELLPKTAK